MIDLLHDGGDVSMQHSVIKGLQEVAVCGAQQAESLIARGMLKRATAMTNSNSQSSRSHCIITIRCGFDQSCEEVDCNTSDSTILTIVDLAGEEREKMTGNQGARLLESNFINNTSMVFGHILRSRLEHQKNQNETMQKHYKNSLLTRYLQDYLEGKKRMMLILTIKPGVDDYLDTSFLLRHASPFAKSKFKNVEEPVVVLTNKRPSQALPEINGGQIDRGSPQNLHEELSKEATGSCHNSNTQGFCDEKISLKGIESILFQKDREYKILQGFTKASWNVLKQYKEKLEGVEIENCQLRDKLANEKTRSLELENRLTNVKLRIFDLEKSVETPEFAHFTGHYIKRLFGGYKGCNRQNFKMRTEACDDGNWRYVFSDQDMKVLAIGPISLIHDLIQKAKMHVYQNFTHHYYQYQYLASI